MRQSQWECNDPAFFRQLFSQAETLFLSIATEEHPYVVPVNFVYLDGKLYFHSSPKGTKMELIARDGRVQRRRRRGNRPEEIHHLLQVRLRHGPGHHR